MTTRFFRCFLPLLSPEVDTKCPKMYDCFMIIAITGGIGSGKTTVCRHLMELGYPVVIADEVNSHLLEDKSYLSSLREFFPDAFPDGLLSKGILRDIVFSNPDKLDVLNSLAKQYLSCAIAAEINAAAAKSSIVFAELPLLFEWGLQSQFDAIWVICASSDDRQQRVSVRSGLSADLIRNIQSSQQDYSDISTLAPNAIIIENSGNVDELFTKIDILLAELK